MDKVEIQDKPFRSLIPDDIVIDFTNTDIITPEQVLEQMNDMIQLVFEKSGKKPVNRVFAKVGDTCYEAAFKDGEDILKLIDVRLEKELVVVDSIPKTIMEHVRARPHKFGTRGSKGDRRRKRKEWNKKWK